MNVNCTEPLCLPCTVQQRSTTGEAYRSIIRTSCQSLILATFKLVCGNPRSLPSSPPMLPLSAQVILRTTLTITSRKELPYTRMVFLAARVFFIQCRNFKTTIESVLLSSLAIDRATPAHKTMLKTPLPWFSCG